MVAGGWSSNNLLDSVEIIDLTNDKNTCEDFPNLLYPVSDAKADVNSDDKPLVCGGRIHGKFHGHIL